MEPLRSDPGAMAGNAAVVDALEAGLRGVATDGATRAYEVGRDAMAAGASIPDVVVLCMETLRRHLSESESTVASASPETVVDRAAQFMAECLAPYEMSHRGYQETVETLRRVNGLLEREVQRIGHALHDQAGQLMVSVHLALHALESEVSPPSLPRLREIGTTLQRVEQQLRNLSHELVPTMLADLGWYPALDFLAQAMAHRTGVRIVLDAADRSRLAPAQETVLYRLVQEALTNSTRHSGAPHVQVTVERRAAWIRCVVRDDGRGFDPQAGVSHGGLGLRAMRERVGAAGGTLLVDSRPGRGTRIEVRLPIDAP